MDGPLANIGNDIEYCTVEDALDQFNYAVDDDSSDGESVHTSDEECPDWSPVIETVWSERGSESSAYTHIETKVRLEQLKESANSDLQTKARDNDRVSFTTFDRKYKVDEADELERAHTDISEDLDIVNKNERTVFIKTEQNSSTSIHEHAHVENEVIPGIDSAEEETCYQNSNATNPTCEIKCEMMDTESSTDSEMQGPKKELSPREQFECNICGRSYARKSSFTRHRKTHGINRRNPATDAEETGPFPCEICGKLFKMKVNLDLHMRVHNGTTEHNCTVCGFKFSRKSDLKRHMLTHTGEKPYKCSICGKGFRLPGEFNRHKAFHRGENMCKYCGKNYQRKVDLLAHLAAKHESKVSSTHNTDEAGFPCEICSKVLKSEFNLKQHIDIVHGAAADLKPKSSKTKHDHVREKSVFKCEHCSRTFNLNSNRRRHERNMHAIKSKNSEKDYSCDGCGKAFSSERNLKEHVQVVI